MGEIAEVVGKLVEPITKLIDCARRGIGVLYEPLRIRRSTDASVYQINEISKVMRDNCDIPIEYSSEGVSISAVDPEQLIQRTKERLNFEALRRQGNTESVLGKTSLLLESEEAVVSEPVEDDWLFQFFGCVEDISNETMQQIWARVLAGEIVKPNSFSKRTLSVLKSLSLKEATLFTEIAPYVLHSVDEHNPEIVHYYIPQDSYERKELKRYGLSTAAFNILEDAGIMSMKSTLGIPFVMKKNEERCIYANKRHIRIVNHNELETELIYRISLLTTAGIELLPIALSGQSESSIEYMNDVISLIKRSIRRGGSMANVDFSILMDETNES